MKIQSQNIRSAMEHTIRLKQCEMPLRGNFSPEIWKARCDEQLEFLRAQAEGIQAIDVDQFQAKAPPI